MSEILLNFNLPDKGILHFKLFMTYSNLVNCTFVNRYEGFPGSLVVKNLPEMQETQVRSLGREVPLEKTMATHSDILAWRIPWTEEPGRLQSIGLQRVGHD